MRVVLSGTVAASIVVGTDIEGSVEAADDPSAQAARCTPGVFLDIEGAKALCRPRGFTGQSLDLDYYDFAGLRWRDWGEKRTRGRGTVAYCSMACQSQKTTVTVYGLEIRRGRKYLYRSAKFTFRGRSVRLRVG